MYAQLKSKKVVVGKFFLKKIELVTIPTPNEHLLRLNGPSCLNSKFGISRKIKTGIMEAGLEIGCD
jgi:hypothetical protein